MSGMAELLERHKKDMPEWAKVWYWARFKRAPRDLRPFPQQYPEHPPPYMNELEYDGLRQQWIDAGRP